ncbi:936_t:CDS:2, partial [Racocetra fulgida]
NDPPENETHYRSVLNDIGPKDSINCNIEPFLAFLPPPKPFNVWFDKLENLIKTNKSALIGEVGLDKSARLTDPKTKSLSKVQTTIQHQIAILEKQLDLAAKYNRAVTVPEDRLLIESDFHSPEGLDHLMERIVLLVSEAKG